MTHDAIKTYGWQSPEQLKFINSNPQVLSLLYDLSILPEEISARVRGYVEDERERMVKWAKEKARGHRELAIQRQDAGDDEMASQHIALESAYCSLWQELHESQERNKTV